MVKMEKLQNVCAPIWVRSRTAGLQDGPAKHLTMSNRCSAPTLFKDGEITSRVTMSKAPILPIASQRRNIIGKRMAP